MKRLIFLVAVAVVVMVGVGIVTPAFAQWKVGLNYPGVQIGWLNPQGRYATEIRGEYDFEAGKIWTLGPRFTYYILPLSLEKRNVALFCALEGNYISFEGEASKGTGYCAQGMVGVEQPIMQRVSLEASFGGVYLNLTDKKTSFNERSFEPVFQIGLNYYLGGD